MLNYARALLTGQPFLGEFPIIPLEQHQRIAFLNFEVGGKMLARWAHDIGIDEDRLYLVNLRGRRNPLGRDDDRAQLADQLRSLDVAVVMVDPFGRAYTGESQNDNAEVQRFLVDLDMFVRTEVGATDLVLAAHAGWDGERTRGASALEDWPDTIITLTGDGEGEDRKRFMRALGRDVEVVEDEVLMDPLTRNLSRAGTGPKRSKSGPKPSRVADLAVLVTRVVNAAGEPLGRNQIREAVLATGEVPKVGEQAIKDAIGAASKGEFIVVHEGVGPRNGHVIHRRDHHCSHCSVRSAEQSTTTAPGTYVVVPEQCGQESTPPEQSREQSQTPRRVVERVVGGERFRVNLDTGEMSPVNQAGA